MAIAFSNHAHAANSTTSPYNTTVTINAGDTVVVMVLVVAAGAVTVAVTDNVGNIYAQKVAASNTNNCQGFMWATLSAVAATTITTTITGAFTGSSTSVCTYSGVSAFGTTNTATASASPLSIALSTQDANNFVVAGYGIQSGSAATVTASVGNLRDTSATLRCSSLGDNTALTASSVTNTVTTNSITNGVILALELRCPSGGIVWTGNSGTATATSGTIAATVTINAGDTVVVCISVNAGAGKTISGVVDSSGTNVYAQQATKINTANCQTFIWAALNVGSSATSVTVTVVGSYTNAEVAVATYTGVASLGTTNTISGTAANLTISLTTQDINNFVVASFAQNATSTIALSNQSVGSLGNLRAQICSAASFEVVGATDNSAELATSVPITTISNRSQIYAAAALELRAPATTADVITIAGNFTIR